MSSVIVIAGILYNVSVGRLSSASGEIMTNVVKVLAEVLEQDVCTLLRTTAELIAQITVSISDIEEPQASESEDMV